MRFSKIIKLKEKGFCKSIFFIYIKEIERKLLVYKNYKTMINKCTKDKFDSSHKADVRTRQTWRKYSVLLAIKVA